jgi:oligoribonuclease
MPQNANNLIWIDCEMTGLNPEKERLIEIATVVTDPYLTILAEGPVFAIHQSDELLKSMDAWNTKQHNLSGLVDRVKASTVTEAEAEEKTIEFLRSFIPAGKSPMCGNSVYLDRCFLARYMPNLERYFHYRALDVSTLKELALRWAPRVYAGVQKESKHLALDDIRESIEELRYYRDHLFDKNVFTMA